MNRKFYIVCAVLALLFMGTPAFGQRKQQVYLGLGMGLDYGGVGGKIEYLPIEYFGIFGGVGYNLLSIGWNVGATFKILPDKRVSPNLMFFYGYNGALKVIGAPEYEKTSYGVTIGTNFDITVSRKGHKLSVGLFVPIRSSEFMDHYNEMKNSSYIEIESGLTPVALSCGFNFAVINSVVHDKHDKRDVLQTLQAL